MPIKLISPVTDWLSSVTVNVIEVPVVVAAEIVLQVMKLKWVKATDKRKQIRDLHATVAANQEIVVCVVIS